MRRRFRLRAEELPGDAKREVKDQTGAKTRREGSSVDKRLSLSFHDVHSNPENYSIYVLEQNFWHGGTTVNR